MEWGHGRVDASNCKNYIAKVLWKKVFWLVAMFFYEADY